MHFPLSIFLALFGCEASVMERDAGLSPDSGALTDSGTIGADSAMATDSRSEPSDVVQLGDSAATDTPTDTGVIDPVCPADAVLCDGFESPEFADHWEPDDTPMGSSHFEIDSSVAREGTRSFYMHFGEGTGEGSILLPTRERISAPDDLLYVRFYVRFGDLNFSGFHPIYVSLVEDDKFSKFSIPVHGFGSIRGDPAMNMIGNTVDNAQIWRDHSFVANEWKCMEIMFNGGTAPDHDDEESRVWVEGEEVAAMHGTDDRWFNPDVARWSPIYDGSFLRLGVASFGPEGEDPPAHIWIDALVVAHSPIGCLP